MDSTIFIYHFTGASEQCREFLQRCEKGELKGITSVTVLAQVTHRLMMVEAIAEGLVSPGNVAQKLRKNPRIIKKLRLYQEQTEKIPLMGVEIEPLDLNLVLSGMAIRKRYGLMTNDSLIVATVLARKIRRLASADPDFGSVKGVSLYSPADISVNGR